MCIKRHSRSLAATLLITIAVAVTADDKRAPATAAPLPRKVTLRAANEPLERVLADFSKQTRIPVTPKLDRNPPVSLELRDESFWPALDKIATAAEARVDLYGKSGLALVKRGPNEVPVSYDGL